jgi:hypothetical protein
MIEERANSDADSMFSLPVLEHQLVMYVTAEGKETFSTPFDLSKIPIVTREQADADERTRYAFQTQCFRSHAYILTVNSPLQRQRLKLLPLDQRRQPKLRQRALLLVRQLPKSMLKNCKRYRSSLHMVVS